jgi:beta-glucosidase
MTDFPADFIFGVSTSAPQNEGAVREGGRGESVWDRYAHQPGTIVDGRHGDVASDQFHRYEEDLDLMAELGLDAWRFSIAWSRVFPAGSGAINRPGLDYYDRLIDACLERGITPWVCYHHYDLPQKLHIKGGWANRDAALWYTDYIGETASRITDRVKHHILMNEPSVMALWTTQMNTVYRDLSRSDVYHGAIHHQNLATGMGAKVLRSLGSDLALGSVVEAPWLQGDREEEEDYAAAEKARTWIIGASLDPLLKGIYPEAVYERLLPFIKDEDLATCHTALDFLGLNHYGPRRFRPADNSRGYIEVPPPDNAPLSETGIEIRPEAMGNMIARMAADYPDIDLYITGNGGAFADHEHASGTIRDHDRIDYMADNLAAAHEALGKGAPLKGYFAWTLTDNFEWTQGFSKRFGLVHTDFGTQVRTPKASYNWYRDVVQSRRLR